MAQHNSRPAGTGMGFSMWLSWRELNGRRTILYINVILIALLIALPVSLELMGNARKSAVKTRVDYIGPSLILAPEGVLSSDLSTGRPGPGTFPEAVLADISSRYSSLLKSSEARLTRRLAADGREMPVTGIDFRNAYSYPFTRYSAGPGEVVIGEVTSERLGKDMRDTIRIGNGTFRVSGIIPTSGSIEDASLFVPLNVLQQMTGSSEMINEIRLFPESVRSYEKLKDILREYRAAGSGRLSLIDAYRGDTAEKEIDSALLGYQKALYTVAFVLIALCVMISTYINLDSRKSEVSTVHTLGAEQKVILQMLTLRTVWITVLGAAAGYMLSVLITVIQAPDIPLRFIWSSPLLIKAIAGTAGLGVAVTVPFALYSVYRRDPTESL